MTVEEPAIVCSELAKAFNGVRVLESVTLEIQAGEIIGIIGANGAGKTVLLDIVSGFLRPDRGEVRIRGKRVTNLPPESIADLSVGRLFQNLRIFEAMTVGENLLVGTCRLRCGWGSVARSFLGIAIPSGACAQSTELARAIRLFDRFDDAGRHFSVGQRRLLAIARMLARRPEILLLDEPLAGLDEQWACWVVQNLRSVVEAGGSAIFIDHDIDAVKAYCTRIYRLDEGRLESC